MSAATRHSKAADDDRSQSRRRATSSTRATKFYRYKVRFFSAFCPYTWLAQLALSKNGGKTFVKGVDQNFPYFLLVFYIFNKTFPLIFIGQLTILTKEVEAQGSGGGT